MIALGQAAALAGTALPFVVSPGASFALTVQQTAGGRRRAALPVMGGTALGIATLAGVLTVTPVGDHIGARARAALSLLGGAYLAVLGIRMLIGGARRPVRERAAAGRSPSRRTDLRVARQAYLTLVLNPKALGVYLVVVPALAARFGGRAPYLPFASCHIALTVAWLTFVGALTARLPGAATSGRWARVASVVAGTCVLASAVAVAAGVL